MVKVQAPALSMEASGKIGGCMVFSSWKGRAYCRSLVKPTNPRTTLQSGIRAAMKFLAQIWAAQTAEIKAGWAELAANKNVSPFNAFVAENMVAWRNGFGLSPTPSPIREGGACALTTLTATGAARHVQLNYEADGWVDEWAVVICRSLITGFTPTWATAIAILPLPDSDPHAYIDSGLTPETYYYRACTAALNGSLGTFFAEQDAIVT